MKETLILEAVRIKRIYEPVAADDGARIVHAAHDEKHNQPWSYFSESCSSLARAVQGASNESLRGRAGNAIERCRRDRNHW